MTDAFFDPFAGTDDPADPVARALDYPFAQEDRSFLFRDGRIVPLDEDPLRMQMEDVGDEDGWYDLVGGLTGEPIATAAERIAIIAAGSNSSPAQLARKFRGQTDGQVIPVLRAVLEDYAVVYAALISGYGAVPATNHFHPGVSSNVFVTLLSPRQFRQMNVTEDIGDAYAFASLRRGRTTIGGVPLPTVVHGYFALPGALLDEDRSIVSLRHTARDETLPQLSQPEIQSVCARIVTGVDDPHTFVRRHIGDPARRRETVAALAQKGHAAPPSI